MSGHNRWLDLVELIVEPVGRPAYDMQDRAKDFAVEQLGARDLPGLRGKRCRSDAGGGSSLVVCSRP